MKNNEKRSINNFIMKQKNKKNKRLESEAKSTQQN